MTFRFPHEIALQKKYFIFSFSEILLIINENNTLKPNNRFFTFDLIQINLTYYDFKQIFSKLFFTKIASFLLLKRKPNGLVWRIESNYNQFLYKSR